MIGLFVTDTASMSRSFLNADKEYEPTSLAIPGAMPFTPVPLPLHVALSGEPHVILANPHDTLFRFIVDCRLKNTTGQRLDSANKLGLFLIAQNGWSSIKLRMWEICLPSLQPLAIYGGEVPCWSLSTEPPTIEQFDKYIALRIETSGGARNLPLWQTDRDAHIALSKLREKTITMSVYKWGNELATGPQFAAFSKACIEPANVDRSGAASESEQQDIISQLKAKWHNLSAPEMAWRIWANDICQLPNGQRERVMLKGPPQNIITLFRSTSTSAHQRILRLKRNCHLALDLVNGTMDQLTALRADILQQRAVMDSRLDAFETMFRSKREIIEGYAEDLDPSPDDIAVLRVLGAIPSQEDNDHT
ncbi:hypothetical protein AC1031_021043 [Aphanomyces cochlioides]|nr:hypothetical protein AC1031_021043 [Aphanomyces cochlioides]